MKGDKRRIKKIVTGLVILVLLGITLSGVRIRSVGQYKQEQKQLAMICLLRRIRRRQTTALYQRRSHRTRSVHLRHREERQRQNRGNRRQSLKR